MMKIKVQDHTLINIDEDLGKNGNGLTKDEGTPYLSVLRKQSTSGKGFSTTRSVRVRCLSAVYEKLKHEFRVFYEPMGGVGVTASIFTQNGERCVINELDPECVEVIEQNFPQFEIHNRDMFEFEPETEYDCAFLDFNNFTLKKFLDKGGFFDVANRTFENSEKFVVVNDCSPFYLSRGAKSFEVYSKLLGVKVSNLVEYYTALRAFYKTYYPVWNLEFVERFYQSGYLVFKRGGTTEGRVENNFHDAKLEKTDPSLQLLKDTPNRLF